MARKTFKAVKSILDQGAIRGTTRVWTITDWTLVQAIEAPKPKWQTELGDDGYQFVLAKNGERIPLVNKNGDQLRTCAKLIIDAESGEWFGILPDMYDKLASEGGPLHNVVEGQDISGLGLVIQGAWSEPEKGSTMRNFLPAKWKLARV